MDRDQLIASVDQLDRTIWRKKLVQKKTGVMPIFFGTFRMNGVNPAHTMC
jgi:hypothetical protein